MSFNPNKFIELSLFAIAASELSQVLLDKDAEINSTQGALQIQEAVRLAKIAATKELLVEFSKELYPLVQEADTNKKIKKIDLLIKATRKSASASFLFAHGAFLKQFYKAIPKTGGESGPICTAIFKNKSPARLKAVQIARTCQKSGLSLASDLFNFPNKSRKHVEWLQQSLTYLDAAPSVMEVLEEEVATANEIAEEIGVIEQKIKVEDPVSEDSAKLESKKKKKKDKLESLISKSKSPEVVASSAIKTLEQASINKTAKRLGLTAEQEKVILAEGRVLVAATAGSGKCIRWDSIIPTEKGFITLGDLSSHLEEGQEEPLVYQIQGFEGPEFTSHIYRNGVQQTIKIQTERGYELEGTPNHRIFVWDKGVVKWGYLRDLKEGQRVCIDRREGLFSNS